MHPWCQPLVLTICWKRLCLGWSVLKRQRVESPGDVLKAFDYLLLVSKVWTKLEANIGCSGKILPKLSNICHLFQRLHRVGGQHRRFVLDEFHIFSFRCAWWVFPSICFLLGNRHPNTGFSWSLKPLLLWDLDGMQMRKCGAVIVPAAASHSLALMTPHLLVLACIVFQTSTQHCQLGLQGNCSDSLSCKRLQVDHHHSVPLERGSWSCAWGYWYKGVLWWKEIVLHRE